MDDDQQKSVVGGMVLLALAAGIFFFVSDDSGGAGGEKRNDRVGTATCAMTTAAVPLFAAAVRGRSAGTLSSIGGVGTAVACEVALERLRSDPDQPVPLHVETSGQLWTGTVTVADLLAQPSPPPMITFSTRVACLTSYRSDTESLMLKLCYDGIVQPRG